MDKPNRHLIVNTCVAALILTGCVSQNTPVSWDGPTYRDYRAMLIDQAGKTVKFPAGTPQAVKDRYHQCATDLVLTAVSPEDLAKLDAFAQRRQELTRAEMQRIDAAVVAKIGRPLTQGGLERLSAICPQSVPIIQQYPPYE